MASALTRFGQHCRGLRSHRGMTLGDQAEALGCEPSEISSIEMGVSPLPANYSQRLVDWLNLNESEQRDLLKKVETNVVAFPRRTSTGGDKTSSMRLFRKISRMRPNEIRSFGKPPPPENKNDG
jgi:transcriptional regulator with XRE-family HTH domain